MRMKNIIASASAPSAVAVAVLALRCACAADARVPVDPPPAAPAPPRSAAPQAEAPPSWRVLRADGTWTRATLSETGTFATESGAPALDGAIAVLAPEGVAALERTPARSRSRPALGYAELRLADGQRFPGTLAGAFTSDDGAMRIVWKHARLGAIDVPLDRVAAMTLQAGTSLPSAQSADILQLANGDTIEGVVEGIGEVIVLEKDGQRREVPLERVAACAFVTTPRPRERVRMWLDDGTVVDGSGVMPVSGGAVALTAPPVTPGRNVAVVQQDEIYGVSIGGDAGPSAVPLAALAPAVSQSADAALATEPPRAPRALDPNAPLGLSALEIRGPVRLVYEVPKGSKRLTGNISVPEPLRRWAHAPVRIMQGGRALLSTTLDEANPDVALDLALDPALSGSAGALSIEICEGQRGSIGDVLVLERGMLLVE